MKEETLKQYLSLGEHFVKTVKEKYSHLGHIPPEVYKEELLERAKETTPAYWRRLRIAYKEWCFDKGYNKQGNAIKTLKNPLTNFGEYKKKPLPTAALKRKKATTLKDGDIEKIIATSNNDKELIAVVAIMNGLGVRPSEIKEIQFKDTKFKINGAKKTEKSDRGLDRIVEVNEDVAKSLHAAIKILKASMAEKNITCADIVSRVQRRFDRYSLKTFPKRKLKICLYTIRHQFGSNLKSSGISRKEMAYIMGHQSTKSIDRYGDRRQGSGKSAVRATSKEYENLVRENHKAIDSARKYTRNLDSEFIYN